MRVTDRLPDLAQARRNYAQLAARYDANTRLIDGIRLRAVALLNPQPGEVIADVACGTGFCLPWLSHEVGPDGLVIGIEASPEMLAIAEQRCRHWSLHNVSLQCMPACDARLERAADGFLFSYAHDVLQCDRTLSHLLAQGAPKSRVVSVGTKLFPWWLAVLNPIERFTVRHYLSAPDTLRAPWARLAARVPNLQVQTQFPGSRYLARGSYEPA